LLGLLPASDINLLGESNAESYWERSDRFDMGIDLSADTRGMAALGAVITRWLSHLLAIEVVTDPLTELHDAPFSWYVGLSSEGTRIGDAIWKDNDLADTIRTQLIGLFRLTFRDPSYAIERLQGEAVYLLMAITADQLLLLKPQNLIAGLPIRHLGATN